MRVIALVDAVRSLTGDVESETDVTTEQLFKQLSNERRRVVIRHLYHDIEDDEIVSMRDLAEFVTIYEYGEDYSSDDRKRVYIALWQSHLEKLESAGLVELLDDHEIQPGPNLGAAVELLETAEDITGGGA